VRLFAVYVVMFVSPFKLQVLGQFEIIHSNQSIDVFNQLCKISYVECQQNNSDGLPKKGKCSSKLVAQ